MADTENQANVTIKTEKVDNVNQTNLTDTLSDSTNQTDTTVAPNVSNSEETNGDRKRKLDETLNEEETAGNNQGEKKIKEEKIAEAEKKEEKKDEAEKKEEEKKDETDKIEEGKRKEDDKKEQDKEAYAYSKRGDFTSEVFKIIVKGLPKFFGIGEIRKHFEALINARVCKVIPLNRDNRRSNRRFNRQSPFESGVFVTFYDEETRTQALSKLDGYCYKGKKLRAVKANALPDPFIVIKNKNPDPVDEDPEIKMKDTTVPLWNVPYEEQLEMKMEDARKQIHQMVASIEQYQPKLKPWFDSQRAKYDGLPVQLDPIRPCLKREGYRNKCEFSIGLHPRTKEITVGFRYGKYSDGSVYIGCVTGLVHIHARMKTVVSVFEGYLRRSSYGIFDVVSQTGHWKLLMSRYSDSSDQLMIKIGFDPQNFTKEQLDVVRAELKDFFENSEEGKRANCTSIHFQLMPRRLAPGQKSPPVELLAGTPTITQQLFALNFSVSPASFFQVNTGACVTLYETVAELAQLTKETTLLDVCSGVGTIGLCLADRCGEVLGVESNEEAVADARSNAKANGITNASFHHGLAEHLTGQLLHRAQYPVVAVLDPPRAGIHHRLASTLRASPLESIVYLACEPKSVLTGFNGLAHASSKKFAKSPFIPTRLVPVDMFPYTRGVEWVILLQRYDSLLSDY